MPSDEKRSSEILSKIGSALGGVVAFVFIVGVSLNSCGRHVESIPDNAKVLMNAERKEWAPDMDVSWKRIRSERLEGEWAPGTWKDVKERKYELPSGWESYWQNYTTGHDVGLVQHWVFPGKDRWNKDGSWNY